jgi:hypothetical protein
LFDYIGLSPPSLISTNNHDIVRRAIKNGHEASDQLQALLNKLETYIGVKARYFEIKVELREEYVRKVAQDDPAAHDELKTLVRHRDNY